MEILTIDQAKKTSFNELSIALGTFDGLHRGHLELVDAAKRKPGQSAVFTFDALPMDLFQKDHKPMRLFTNDEKISAFKKTGIDYLCIAHFDKEFAGIEKTDFVYMLVNSLKPVNLIAGFNYTYGKNAEGNVELLQQKGTELGFSVEVIPPVNIDGAPVSSTRIRESISAGDIENANHLLGYTYSMSGIVEHGKGIGTKKIVPTANILVPKEKIIPKDGVYSVNVKIGNVAYKGICNIGTNPTVSSDAKQTIEVHILSFDSDIYDKNITIEFNRRIRAEKKFDSVEQLKEQIRKDIDSI